MHWQPSGIKMVISRVEQSVHVVLYLCCWPPKLTVVSIPTVYSTFPVCSHDVYHCSQVHITVEQFRSSAHSWRPWQVCHIAKSLIIPKAKTFAAQDRLSGCGKAKHDAKRHLPWCMNHCVSGKQKGITQKQRSGEPAGSGFLTFV